jgi:DNA-binding protein
MDFSLLPNCTRTMNLTSSSTQEKRVKEIVLKAMGQAISKTVAITEIIKVCLLLVVLF